MNFCPTYLNKERIKSEHERNDIENILRRKCFGYIQFFKCSRRN